MSLNLNLHRLFSCTLIMTMLSGCFHPPFNNFKPHSSMPQSTSTLAGVGVVAGAVASGTATGTVIGGVAGGVVGAAVGLNKDSKKHIIKMLAKEDVQYIVYGDTQTLIVPTDKYFMFDSPRLNEVCYPALNHIVQLLKFYPKTPIYVAAFTDNVGSRRHKRLLTQAQAETMMTFLWANGIQAYRLKAEGYADKYDISDNALIHGSAQNRRIEIQWFTGLEAQPRSAVMTK